MTPNPEGDFNEKTAYNFLKDIVVTHKQQLLKNDEGWVEWPINLAGSNQRLVIKSLIKLDYLLIQIVPDIAPVTMPPQMTIGLSVNGATSSPSSINHTIPNIPYPYIEKFVYLFKPTEKGIKLVFSEQL